MKKLKLFFALFAMLALNVGNAWGAESLQVTLDFTTNSWNLPTSSKVVEEQSFTSGSYTIKVKGTSGNGYQFNAQKYLIMGKSGATLTLPAFDFNTTKIVVTGKSGASGSVGQNIFVGNTAVSTATTGATGTNTYTINADYQAAGNVYVLKVTTGHNTQITKIEIYGEASGGGETPGEGGGEDPETPGEGGGEDPVDPTPDPGNATTGTLVITRASFPSGSLAYNTTDNWSATASTGETVSGQGDLYSTSNQTTMQTKNSGVSTHYHNTTAMPGAISKISVEVASGTDRSYTVYASTTAIASTNGLTSLGSLKGATPIEIDPTKDYKYFWLQCTGGASYLNNITITYNIESSGGDEGGSEEPVPSLTAK